MLLPAGPNQKKTVEVVMWRNNYSVPKRRAHDEKRCNGELRKRCLCVEAAAPLKRKGQERAIVDHSHLSSATESAHFYR